MTEESISWSIFTTECYRTRRRSNKRPSHHQSDAHLTELMRPANKKLQHRSRHYLPPNNSKLCNVCLLSEKCLTCLVFDLTQLLYTVKPILTFTTLWAYSKGSKLWYFSIFGRKQDLTFHANCFHLNEKYFNMSKILPGTLCFKGPPKRSHKCNCCSIVTANLNDYIIKHLLNNDSTLPIAWVDWKDQIALC